MFLQFLQYFNWSLQKKLLKNNWQCNFHNVIRSLADRSWNLDSGWCNPACHMYQIFNPWTIYSKFHCPTFTGSIFFNFIPISAKASKYISRNHFQHWLFWAHHVGQILASFHLLQPFWENNCHEKGVFCGKYNFDRKQNWLKLKSKFSIIISPFPDGGITKRYSNRPRPKA